MGKKGEDLFEQIHQDDENLTLEAKGWRTGDPAADLLGDIRDDVEYG